MGTRDSIIELNTAGAPPHVRHMDGRILAVRDGQNSVEVAVQLPVRPTEAWPYDQPPYEIHVFQASGLTADGHQRFAYRGKARG